MPPKPRVAHLPLYHPREAKPLHLVGDGAIAHPEVGEGRLIAVAILDTTGRPDIDEFIRLHEHIVSGDASMQWGMVERKDHLVRLIIRVLRPAELVAIIEFDLDESEGIMVEQILTTKALYIQAGRKGDSVSRNWDRPKVIVEVPDTGFREAWDSIYLKHSVARMLKEGFNRAEAKRRAKAFIEKTKETVRMRIPTVPEPD